MGAGMANDPAAILIASRIVMSLDFHNRPIGFEPPRGERSRKRQRTACAQLVLTLALAASTAVAITAVSMGMAHAYVPAPQALARSIAGP